MRNLKLCRRLTLLGAISVILLMQACSIEKPEAPSWETQWDVPLTSKTYSVEDILDQLDSEEIEFDSLGNPYFSITQEIDTIEVAGNLPTLASISESISQTVGIVEIEAPSMSPATFALDDLVNPNYLIIGVVPIDTSFSQSTTLSQFDNFSMALIEDGLFEITITNDLGVNLDSLAVTLYNTVEYPGGTALGMAIFENGINNNQTLSRQINLAGKTLYNQFTFEAIGEVLAQPIQDPTQDLSIGGNFVGALTVASATAELPEGIEIEFDRQIEIDIDDSSVLYRAVVESGILNIPIANNSGLPMAIDILLPNFKLNNIAMTFNTVLDPHTSDNLSVNLADYTISPDTTVVPQTIAVMARAMIPASGVGHMYNIAASDSVNVSANVSSITFQSVTGVIAPQIIEVNLDPQNVDLPEGFEEVQLTQAQLTMNLYNNSTSDIFVDISMVSNVTGVDPLGIQDTIAGKELSSSAPEFSQLAVGSADLSTFLNPAPSMITINGSAVFNPNSEVISITNTDYFYGEVEIYSPLAFALADTAEVDLDISDVDMGNADDRPDFEDTFVEGAIHSIITSHLPVGASIMLYISTNPTPSADANAVTIGPLVMEPAYTDSSGYVTTEISSTYDDTLTAEEISIFDNDMVYIEPVVKLLPTGEYGGTIQSTDFINIRARANLRVIAGENLWENNN